MTKIAVLCVALLVLCGGGYVAAAALAPEPPLTAELAPGEEAPRSVTPDAAGAQAIVDAQALPTAIGWHHDDEVWSNDDAAYPLGSIAKLITVLVTMDYKPLAPGADGDIYTWTAADAARTRDYLAMDGVAYAIPVGTQLTQRQMLEFIFLPSANDYAHAYALWVFGSNDAFLEALAGFTERHGLHSVQLTEPTGMVVEDHASAADLVRIARLALANPTIAELNATPTAVMPWGVGQIENSNQLLGVMPGVIGTKTGTIYSAYNFIVSQRVDVAGRELVNIAVTLARPSKQARADSGREMLTAMGTLPQAITVVTQGERVGTVTAPTGETVGLIAAESLQTTLVPGEEALRHTVLTPVTPGPAGAQAGVIRVTTSQGEHEIPILTDAPIGRPDLAWRLTHPQELFMR